MKLSREIGRTAPLRDARAATVLHEVLALGPDALRAAPPDLLTLAYGFHAIHAAVAGGRDRAASSFDAAIRLGRGLDRAGSHPLARLFLLSVDTFASHGERGVAGLAAAGEAGGDVRATLTRWFGPRTGGAGA